jgi:hypothetical protein
MTHEEELKKLRELYAKETGRKIRRSFTRPIMKSSTIFLLTGCILLVIKLATVAEFSWLWVFGTMFFPFWLIVGFILTVIALVLAAVCLVIAIGVAIAPFWLCWVLWRKYQDNRKWALRKALIAEMQRRKDNELIDRR